MTILRPVGPDDSDVETGLASPDEYRELTTRDLRELLGANVELVALREPRARGYGRPDPRTAWIQLPGGSHIVELRRRSLVFSEDEARLLRAYADALQAFGLVPRVFATTASEDVLTRAIAVRCSSRPTEARTLETVMKAVVRHSNKTYEGTRVAVNVCLDLTEVAGGEPLASFLEQPWAPILGSGLSSAVHLAGDGSAVRVMDLGMPSASDVLAPESFSPVATWTAHEGRVGLSVTRSGEVYLFKGGELLFARRNSRWQGFPLQLILASGWFGATKRQLAPTLKQAVLASLLDASAAHHGACLGIVQNDKVDTALSSLLSLDDRWDNTSNLRASLFAESDFVLLTRRRRLELLSMDGATLLDQAGRILTAGAILRVPGGSPGGGRTAAAYAISTYGVGIKVSQDGPIRAYVGEEGHRHEHFAMG